MTERQKLMAKYGRMNDRFDARFAYMMALSGVRFVQETGEFFISWLKKPICNRSTLMHAEDDIFADLVADGRYEFK